MEPGREGDGPVQPEQPPAAERDVASAAASTSHERRWISQRLTPDRRQLLWAWLPWIAAALLVGLLAWPLVKPAPPDRLVIAAGPTDGAYHRFARQYAETFAASGVTLDVRATAGTVENYALIAGGEADLAIVQGGAAPESTDNTDGTDADTGSDGGGDLNAIASLYLEPVWVFVRPAPAAPGDAGERPEPARDLRDLAGLRVAVGPEGSGTRAIALRLLEANGVAAGDARGDARLLPLTGDAAAVALRDGAADAAVFVIPPGGPLLTSLLRDPGLHLLDFARHEAYAGRFPYLSAVRLPRGVIDLAADLPRADVRLVAPAANLVCRAELHPALVTLSARAATLAHERGDLLSAPGRFPTTAHVEWPVAPAAREYFRSGPPLLQRYLPFWAASLIDRLKVLLLPLLTLALPLLRVAPPLYAWRVRSRIYRWYRVVQAVDERVRRREAGRPTAAAPPAETGATADAHGGDGDRGDGDADREDGDADLQVLRQLESELADVQVPLSYMSEYYNLRVHVDLLRRRLEGPQAPQ